MNAPDIRQQLSAGPNGVQRTTALSVDIISAARMLDVACHIEDAARAFAPECQPRLIWWVQGLDDMRSRAGNTVDDTDRDAVQRAIATRDGSPGAVLLSSSDAISGAVLLLQAPAPAMLHGWALQLRPYVDNALEKSQLRACVDRLARAEKLQRTLYTIADLASADLDMPAMLRGLHEIVGGLLYAANFYIALYDQDRDTISFVYFADTHEEDWQTSELVESLESIRHSLTWYLVRDGQPLMGTVEQLQRQVSGPLAIIGPHAADWLGVPMLSQGRVCGALVVQSYDEHDLYTRDDQALLAFVGTHILTALERKRAQAELERRTAELAEQIKKRARIERQLKHEVLHDSLTGLPNRAYLRDQLARALAHTHRDPTIRVAVLFMDLDCFKRINDVEGHLVGDALLREAASRFLAAARGDEMVARLGGDEFAVLMERVENAEAPTCLAHRLIEALRVPVVVNGRSMVTGVSIGIALSDARHAGPDDLLRDADQAMYSAKAHGRGRVAVYRSDADVEASDTALQRADGACGSRSQEP